MGITKTMWVMLGLAYSCISFSETQADLDIKFKVKPRKCVALHQGQTCYQKLKFHWIIPQAGEYCLHALSQSEPLVCWRSGERERFEYEFASAHGERFQIRNKDALLPLAELEVATAWVYKSRKRKTGSWRLF